MKRYFAVVDGRYGYALDYYPEEERGYRRAEGRRIIGDYDSVELAYAAVIRYLENKKK